MIKRYFAHAGEEHVSHAGNNLLDTVGQLTAPVALSFIVLLLLAFFMILKALHVNLLHRLLAIVPALVLLGFFYSQYNPIVTTVLLSTGFIGVFFLALTLLAGQKS